MTWLLYCAAPDDLPHDLSDLEWPGCLDIVAHQLLLYTVSK